MVTGITYQSQHRLMFAYTLTFRRCPDFQAARYRVQFGHTPAYCSVFRSLFEDLASVYWCVIVYRLFPMLQKQAQFNVGQILLMFIICMRTNFRNFFLIVLHFLFIHLMHQLVLLHGQFILCNLNQYRFVAMFTVDYALVAGMLPEWKTETLSYMFSRVSLLIECVHALYLMTRFLYGRSSTARRFRMIVSA